MKINWNALIIITLVGLIIWLIFCLINQSNDFKKSHLGKLAYVPSLNQFVTITDFYWTRNCGMLFVVKLSNGKPLTLLATEVDDKIPQ